MNNKKEKPSILWYDLETFGLNPHYDRIAQFAAIRTDEDFNQIGKEIILYCKLSKDYLPDPLACLVTGITPQEVNKKGINEDEFIKKIRAEFSVPNTVVTGFNSINFDDEFIRNALYRNLYDPYEREYKNGCSRWDIINLVRAAYDLRPDNIIWPEKKENGNPSFKLTDITKANNIEQIGAHDALVDVRATIEVAKLIKTNEPRLYNYSFTHRKKHLMKNLLKAPFGEAVLHTHPKYTNKNGCTTLVMPITYDTRNPNNVICFNLNEDITPLIEADEDTILYTHGIVNIAYNKCAFVSPLSVLTQKIEKKLNLDKQQALSRAQQLSNHPELILKIRNALAKQEIKIIDDSDFKLYSGFFRDEDYKRFEIIHKTNESEKLQVTNALKFDDSRAGDLVYRHILRNYLQYQSTEEKEKWKIFCSHRIVSPPGNVMITLDFYNRKIEEKLSTKNISESDKTVLLELKDYGQELINTLFN
ncbi:MAG: exodeoxyribonuclease I [Pleomorphochaeta sp.]